MYKDDFPSLYAVYPFPNFETILAVIDKRFSDVFNIAALEAACGGAVGDQGHVYCDVFDKCMRELDARVSQAYLPEEVVKKLCQILETNMEVRNLILKSYILVPGEDVQQIGFLEKLAMGQLTERTPLTTVDMMRMADWFQTKSRLTCGVSNLLDLSSTSVAAKQFILVNFKKDRNHSPQSAPSGRFVVMKREVERNFL